MELVGARLDRIEGRLDEIQALLAALCQKLNRSPSNPLYISLADAAAIVGKSKPSLQKMLQRENDKLDGLKIRRIKGSVHKKDFLRFIEHKASRHPGRGEILRTAIKEIER